MTPRRLYRIAELSEATGVSRQALYDQVGLGNLRAYRVGKILYVDPQDWSDFMRRRATTTREVRP